MKVRKEPAAQGGGVLPVEKPDETAAVPKERSEHAVC